MSLSKLAEKIEDYAVARYTIAVGCILLGLCGFVVSVNQRRQATSQMGTLLSDADTLVSNTNTLVSNTNTVVLMVPEVSELKSRVADLDKKLQAARGNPQLIATLQAEKEDAQAQAQETSKQLLLATVPGIAGQMYDIGDRWNHDDDHLVTNSRQAQEPNEVTEKKAADLSRGYSIQIQPLMATADYLRQQLLEQLPSSSQTDEDRKESVVFAKAVAGDTISPHELMSAATYLHRLSQRVSAKP
jgi:hypothetical protein